jgi:hypothetical protein
MKKAPASRVKRVQSGQSKKKSRRHGYKASDLMANFKPEHRHGEWDLGGPVGKEIW